MIRSFSLANVPIQLSGLALGNIGQALLWYNIGQQNKGSLQFTVMLFIHVILGIFMLLLFTLRCLCHFKPAVSEILSCPAKITTIGIFSVAIALFGKFISNFENMLMPFVSIVIPTVMDCIATLIAMIGFFLFVKSCYDTSTYPEPYFNVAVFALLFQLVGFPGGCEDCITIRNIMFICELICWPMLPYMIARTVWPRKDKIACNPSVCIMQAGPGIFCTAWLSYPITGSAVEGIGRTISHCAFGFSTLSFLLTVVAMYQRRKELVSIGRFICKPVDGCYVFLCTAYVV